MQQNLKILTVLVVGLCLQVGILCAWAESDAAKQQEKTNSAMSIEALVSEILGRNPELNFYREEISAAAGELKTAGAFQNPEISSEVGRKKAIDSSGVLGGEGTAWSVSLQQTFEWPGRIALRKAIANRQLELSTLGLERFKVALASRVRTLAFTLFAAQEKSAAVSEVASRFRSLREVLVSRDLAGITPLLEARIIEATEITTQRKATEAAIAAKSSLLEINKLRGEPWGKPLTIEKPRFTFPKALSFEELISAAATNNFELRAREVELLQQGFKLSLAKNERFPAVSVGPFYSEERAGDREKTFGIGLSLPLPLWNRNSGKIATEEARRSQAETILKTTQREVERQIVEKALTYETKVEEMSRWKLESIQEFQKAAQLADRHYRLGAVPIATFVDLQKQYLEAVEALLETRKETLEALQELRGLTGLGLDSVEPIPERKDRP